MRNCHLPIIGLHKDWCWNTKTGTDFLPLKCTWKDVRTLAFAEGAFPYLDQEVGQFGACYDGEKGELNLFVIMRSCDWKMIYSDNGRGDSLFTTWKGQIGTGTDLMINCVGGSHNLVAMVNEMFDASSIQDLERVIDKWCLVERVVEITRRKNPSFILSEHGTEKNLLDVARIHSLLLLATNNNLLKQMRKQITFAD
jgi:hypothetical protein